MIISVVSIIFSNIVQVLPMSASSIPEVTYRYRSLFVPAGYAFSIWGVIYLSFIIYAIYQVLRRTRRDMLYDKIAIPFMMVNVLGGLWQVVFRFEYITWSVLIIVIMLVLGIVQFRIMRAAVNERGRSWWLSVPFSLFLGWISVATIANISIWCVYMGWRGGPLPETTVAIIVLGIATLLAVCISIIYRDWVYPVVIAWATVAISVAYRAEVSIVSNAALAAAVISLGIAVVNMFRRRQQEISHG